MTLSPGTYPDLKVTSSSRYVPLTLRSLPAPPTSAVRPCRPPPLPFPAPYMDLKVTLRSPQGHLKVRVRTWTLNLRHPKVFAGRVPLLGMRGRWCQLSRWMLWTTCTVLMAAWAADYVTTSSLASDLATSRSDPFSCTFQPYYLV